MLSADLGHESRLVLGALSNGFPHSQVELNASPRGEKALLCDIFILAAVPYTNMPQAGIYPPFHGVQNLMNFFYK